MTWSRATRAAVGAGVGLGALYGYQVAKHRRSIDGRFSIDAPPAPGSVEFSALVEATTAGPSRPGNRVTVLRNGATLGAMLAVIAGAEHTVDLSSYILWPSEIADRFTAALADRARAGVDVNLVVDGYGSAKLDEDRIEMMRRAGVEVARFRAPRWYNLGRVNNRMHRRILVVDGRVGFAGGVGIAEVWTGDAQDPEHWRETHLRIEGPAVADLFGAFVENWTEATGELLTGRHLGPGGQGVDDGVAVQVTRSTPVSGPTHAAELFYAAIAGAQRRLWLTTAYFAPDPAFQNLLCAAARRGVDVRILVNGKKVDKEVVRQASHRSYGPLLEAGVRVFEYEQTMLHAKVLIVDDHWANVGSGNFDSRSFDHDSELYVSLADARCAAELAGHFDEDLKSSKEFTLDAWRTRPVHQRVAEHLSGLVRQSL